MFPQVCVKCKSENCANPVVGGGDDPRRSAELYQVHEPVHPKEIQSQWRVRNKILMGKPQACKNMIRCGLFCSTVWADLKTLRITRERQTSDMPPKEASKSCLVASVAVN
ncbi:hypothetical protein AVEN_130769-1 [Araneus ventricosus]|uniref:Uncharacterized protein n=1 Tax=Araneus ventricosus TaxID=182803 RepID=A0A4Y2GK50_ARAVE|nr:hypothetical protein AVEN_130769-1 [Araneus ventricosus]